MDVLAAAAVGSAEKVPEKDNDYEVSEGGGHENVMLMDNEHEGSVKQEQEDDMTETISVEVDEHQDAEDTPPKKKSRQRKFKDKDGYEKQLSTLARARETARHNRQLRQETGSKAPTSTKDGLVLPYRNIKKIMKLDEDVSGNIQNEAALLMTYAAELFVQKFANETRQHALERGRNTIKYEDVAEVRANNSDTLAFLEPLLP